MRKPFLLSLLVALLTSLSLHAYDFQSGDLYYNITSKTTVEVTYQKSGSSSNYQGLTTATIPETVTYNGTTYSVTSIGDIAFYNCSSLTSITIPNSVTSIGWCAFDGCSSLTSITLPNSVTSIGGNAFSSCSSLTSITIPNSVTSIGSSAFAGCTSLPVEDNLRYADMYLVEAVDKSLSTYTIKAGTKWIGSDAFAGCSSLTSITIPNSVTSIGEWAFYNCSSLTSITLPNSVTSIGYCAFAGCTSLPMEDNLRYADTYLVEAVDKSLSTYTIKTGTNWIGDYAFDGCSSLTSITIPNSVTSIGDKAFYNCSSLTSITIGNSVTSIGWNAFNGCSSLTSIPLPNSVTSIGDIAFYNCSSLTSITIPNSVTSIGWCAFDGCSSLTSIVVESGNTVYDSRYNCNAIIETATNTLIAGCQSTTIPNSVTSIGDLAFYNCSSLTSITIPNSVTSIGGGAFKYCSSLTSITLPNSVTSIGNYAFAYCSALTSITIPNSVTSIGDGAFNGCSSLTSIVVESGNTMYDSRENCNAIIETASNTLIAGCQSTIIPNSVTSIGNEAFYECSSLTSITIPNSVTSIDESAFSGCSSLTSITLPNSVTSIGEYAFWGCSSLTSITIPNSVTSIGSGAFLGCSSLTSVTSLSCTPPSCGSNVFYYTPSEKTLVVPSISMDAYKNSSTWKEFTSFEKCLSVFVQSSDSTLGVAQIDQEVDCDGVAIISTTANYGYHFKQWNDGNADNPRTIKLTQDTTLTAEFAPNQYTLTTTTNYAERGTAQGDTIADYLTEIQVSATANYGYHFSQWSDGNTDNPRTFSLTKDTNLVALFDKNQYTITTSCNAEQGNVSKPQTAEYLDEVTISATANYGYHFTQWSDGNTDTPRTIKLTQDTTFIAEFTPNQYTLTTTTNYAERGTAQGDTIADYLTEIQVSATANYGYHFTQWSDGNTDNPRTFSLTKDTNLVAQFDKNQYTITTYCNAEQGTISGTQVAEYLDEITLNVLPNVGWHFTQWTDSNTDNPRTFTLTQDTTFLAEFAMDYSGKCGDDLYWAYSNQEIRITGSGAMYNYTESTMPWTLFRDSIMTVRVGNNATSIGAYAFAACSSLTSLNIPNSVTSIGKYAFYNCSSLADIYCYATTPPMCETNTFGGVSKHCYIHVPAGSIRDYQMAVGWRDFYHFYEISELPDGAPTDQVGVTVTGNYATFSWPVNPTASSYTLTITKDGEVFCTLIFNNMGQLVGMAFAPARNGEQSANQDDAQSTAYGFSFVVTNLDANSHYTYTFTVNGVDNEVIETYSGSFDTSEVTALSETEQQNKPSRKIIRNGQVLILRNGVAYDMMGNTL